MNNFTNYTPLVSCLCLTRDRPEYLKRAIDCYLAQTYRKKELIVLLRDDDRGSKEVVRSVNRKDIHFFEYTAGQDISLGELRNYSIECSNGEYFCQWDDDDWYHSTRLEMQVNGAIRNYKPASILVLLFVYNAIHKKAYLSAITPWPQTILCKRSIFNDKVRYPPINKFEDMQFFLKLYELNGLYPLVMPYLYLYAYHGGNTYDTGHFDNIFKTSQPLSEDTSRLITAIFNNAILPEKASTQLMSPDVLGQINYLHDWGGDFK